VITATIPSSVLIARFHAWLVASPLFLVMPTVLKLRIWTETRLIKHMFIILPNILKGTTFLHEVITGCYVSCLFHEINVVSKPSRKPASYEEALCYKCSSNCCKSKNIENCKVECAYDDGVQDDHMTKWTKEENKNFIYVFSFSLGFKSSPRLNQVCFRRLKSGFDKTF